MNLYVLSENGLENTHIGWSVSRSLEQVLAAGWDAKFLYPKEDPYPRCLSLPFRIRRRLSKSWFYLDELPTLGKGQNVLLIVGMLPHFLLSMHALPFLKQFDLRVGYLLDAFDPHVVDAAIAPDLDHLFVIDADLAWQVDQQRLVPTHFMPMATNMVGSKLHPGRRSIDLLSYGRRNEAFHRQLLQHLRDSDQNLFYHYSTLLHPQSMNRDEHTLLQSQILSNAKISLCFDGSSEGRFYGRSPLLYRWFEAWAHGCAVVGHSPTGRGVKSLMNWENSVLDLPESPTDWIPFVQSLLADETGLADISRRNYDESLLRHDWRYRLQDMWKILGLSLPAPIQADIDSLILRSRSQAPSPVR
jgi:Glycosyl transferases group 1